MHKERVDLHIHSYYSDGTMSPKEILQNAISNELNVIAITDHNTLEGSNELFHLCLMENVKCISGVELDSMENGINYHILGYGIDFNNTEFNYFVSENNNKMENVNLELILKLQSDFENVTIKDYKSFIYNKCDGGWKALHYLVEKGITADIYESMTYYAKYGNPYLNVKFPPIMECCNYIHKAGGKAILAHPGKVIKEQSQEKFKAALENIIALGIDGIECYYPSHTKEITNICLQLCKKHSLLITVGSDCHGEFEKTKIGELPISHDDLILGDLI